MVKVDGTQGRVGEEPALSLPPTLPPTLCPNQQESADWEPGTCGHLDYYSELQISIGKVWGLAP